MKKTANKILLLIAVTLLLSCVCACQKKEAGGRKQGKLTVVATLFPVYDFARQVGGDKAEVTLLLPPGVEAHSFEPKPADAVRVAHADLFIYTDPYMEPWAADFAKGVGIGDGTVVDSSRGVHFLKGNPQEKEEHGEAHHHEGGMDPHIWLDFADAQIMVDNIAAAMMRKDPAHGSYYAANAAAYKEKLAQLDAQYRSTLATCRTKTFLHGGHYAFGYLAHRYGLQYVSASAVNPDAEPTPGKIIELVRQMRALGLRYVFSEELLSPRVANLIAGETGATILTLHGAHNISREDLAKGVTFVDLMQRNLANLKVGLQCR